MKPHPSLIGDASASEARTGNGGGGVVNSDEFAPEKITSAYDML